MARVAWPMLAILLALIYWAGMSGPFLLDDMQTLEPVNVPMYDFQAAYEVSQLNQTGPLGRPVAVFSFALNHWLGDTPTSFKWINLFIHLLCTLAAFALLRQTVQTLTHKAPPTWLIVAGVSLWALHPLNVSLVLYVVQRMALLSALFAFLSVWSYLNARLRLGKYPPTLWFIASFALALLSIFSKESGLLVVAYIAWFELCLAFHQQKTHRALWLSWSTLGVGALGGLFYYLHRWPYFEAIFSQKGTTLWEQLLTQIQSLCFYLKQTFLPSLSSMGLYHDDFVLQNAPPLWLAVLVLTSLVITIIVCLRKAPIVSFLLGLFFLSHGLESSLLPMEPVFEYRQYVAGFCLWVLALFLGWLLVKDTRVRRGFVVLNVVLVLVFSGLTHLRANSWSSTQLFLATHKVLHPHSYRTQIEWAHHQTMLGKSAIALDAIHQAKSLNPHDAGPYLHALLLNCQHLSEEQLQQTKQALRTKAITPYALMMLDNLVSVGLSGQCPQLSSSYQPLIEHANNNVFIEHNPRVRAILQHQWAGIYLILDNKPKAIDALLTSYELYPKRLTPLLEATSLMIALDDKQRASQTLELIKKHPQGGFKLHQKAIDHLSQEL